MQWEPGARVVVRGEDWRVLGRTAFADCEAIDLASEERAGVRRTFLIPFDVPRAASRPRATMLSTRRWCGHVAAILTDAFPFGGLRFCPAAIRLLPYQLEPALAIFRHGATRVLIGDDVGLGKTVEAGLIIGEVVGAGHNARVLVLTPASLRDQWQQELATVFGIDVVLADAAWLRRCSAQLPADVNPWSLPGVYLASTEFVKRPEALAPLEHVRWELLVLDEAHTATPGSHRLIAINALCCRSRLVVLLTATPHSGDDTQFDALCGMGRVEPGERMVWFRRSRGEVLPSAAPVKSRVIRVTPSSDERAMHRELESYTSRLWAAAARRVERNPALLATLLRKRALSSAASLLRSLDRRLALMESGEGPDEVQLNLPLDGDEEGSPDDVPADAVLGGTGLANADEERTHIQRILAAGGPAAGAESKMRVLLRLLRRVREPAIVFSEYRDTADRVRDALSAAGHRVIVLHGGLGASERRAAVAEFNRGEAVLVATDAASEGLNLHHRCRLVVHFELPWTPARLHQRTGRVDRIGQRRIVHEIALVADDTAEQLVIRPLVQRAGRASMFGVGSLLAQLSETWMASRVLDGAAGEATDVPAMWPRTLIAMDVREEAVAEANRLELLRRLPRPPATADGAPVLPGAIAGHRGDRALTIVVSTTIRDRLGRILEEHTAAVQGTIRGLDWKRHAGWRRSQLESLLLQLGPMLSTRLRARTSRRLGEVRSRHQAVREAVERREAALEGALRSAALELVQVGLFDRVGPRPPTPVAPRHLLDGNGEGRSGRTVGALLRARVRVRAVLGGRLA